MSQFSRLLQMAKSFLVAIWNQRQHAQSAFLQINCHQRASFDFIGGRPQSV
jgi:hypothetical protein